jgi:hypothetical protein
VTVSIEALRLEMEAAAAALDFDSAARLRDRISLLRGGGADVDTAGLERQRPGAMGLGTSQSRVVPPEGWVRPAKPDPMTKGRKR